MANHLLLSRLDQRAVPSRAGADRPGLSARSARARRRPRERSWARARSTSSPGSSSRSRRSPRWSPTRRSSGVRPVARVLASALVALPYLAAAYLAQEAFKEPIMALFVLAFALLLARLRDWRRRSRSACSPRGSPTSTRSPASPGWRGRRSSRRLELWRARRGGRGSPGTGRSVVAPRRSRSGSALPDARLLSLPEAGQAARLRRLPRLAPGSAPTRAGSATCPASSRRSRRSGSGRRASSGSRRRRAACPAVVFYAGGAVRPRLPGARPAALDPSQRHRGPGGVARGGDPLPRRPRPRHRLHLGEGARDRRPAGHCWSRSAACSPSGGGR